jgi:hypothetical protein
MFDFQEMRYSSPMLDLTTFIANSTGYSTRSMNLLSIFKAYHDEMIKNLEGDCVKVPTKIYGSVFFHWISEPYSYQNLILNFSYENFLIEYARNQLFGYIIASFFLKTLHVPEKAVDFENMDFSLTLEDHLESTFKQGGEAVDQELANLILDMYKLHDELGLELE